MNPTIALQNLLDLMATPTEAMSFPSKVKRTAIDNALVQFQQALVFFPDFVPELTRDRVTETYAITGSML